MKDLSVLPENYISWDESVARVGDDEEFLLELLNDLKDLIEENLAKLEQARQDSDFSIIKEIAHGMKGASGNLGLNIMFETTSNLEKSANNSDLESVNKHFSALEEDYKNLKYIIID